MASTEMVLNCADPAGELSQHSRTRPRKPREDSNLSYCVYERNRKTWCVRRKDLITTLEKDWGKNWWENVQVGKNCGWKKHLVKTYQVETNQVGKDCIPRK
eukprot:GEMP01154639.1.p1 GENE.GEMP01154639.1~~GEMP01154639.1.p1  ORF type:complete len:101 (+),score=16.96 GEMP01154639.1:66-368(+)